jgi:hypothetical protein
VRGGVEVKVRNGRRVGGNDFQLDYDDGQLMSI